MGFFKQLLKNQICYLYLKIDLMKLISTFHFLVLLFVSSFVAAQNEPAVLLEKMEGFSHPESVVWDEPNNVFYISNIGEKEKGDGFISKVSPDGEILELKWISGLNDPKGLLVHGDTLFVTDNTLLVEMNIQQGEVIKRTPVVGAEFLNDLTADEQGNIYISDTGKSSVFKRAPNGTLTEWLHTEKLENPNGLLVVGRELYVAAWGKGEGGNVLKVNLENTGEITQVSERPVGNLDGIQRIDADSFYISDWATGKIFRISDSGEMEEILTSAKSAGDILYFAPRKQLILPMNHQNEVWWYQVRE